MSVYLLVVFAGFQHSSALFQGRCQQNMNLRGLPQQLISMRLVETSIMRCFALTAPAFSPLEFNHGSWLFLQRGVRGWLPLTQPAGSGRTGRPGDGTLWSQPLPLPLLLPLPGPLPMPLHCTAMYWPSRPPQALLTPPLLCFPPDPQPPLCTAHTMPLDPKLKSILEQLQLPQLEEVFATEEIDFEAFMSMDGNDFMAMGIKMGPRAKLLRVQKQHGGGGGGGGAGGGAHADYNRDLAPPPPPASPPGESEGWGGHGGYRAPEANSRTGAGGWGPEDSGYRQHPDREAPGNWEAPRGPRQPVEERHAGSGGYGPSSDYRQSQRDEPAGSWGRAPQSSYRPAAGDSGAAIPNPPGDPLRHNSIAIYPLKDHWGLERGLC